MFILFSCIIEFFWYIHIVFIEQINNKSITKKLFQLWFILFMYFVIIGPSRFGKIYFLNEHENSDERLGFTKSKVDIYHLNSGLRLQLWNVTSKFFFFFFHFKNLIFFFLFWKLLQWVQILNLIWVSKIFVIWRLNLTCFFLVASPNKQKRS